jgi:hypothetical protein
MTEDELKQFSLLLFDHKHLWTALQVTRHLREFPDDDPKEVHLRFWNAAYDVYQPLADALLSELPTQGIAEKLRTILLNSTIAQAEAKVI